MLSTKYLFTVVLALAFLISSCEKKEEYVYEYEKNPLYTWGYAEFWGAYYSDYGIDNNVLSLSLLTQFLEVDENYNLVGAGQYLYLEDIFISPDKNTLEAGTYTISDSGDAFTIAPGEEYEVDGQKYDIGAFVYFMEANEAFSKRKFVVGGTMHVSFVENKTRIVFDFVLDDETIIKGSFEDELMYVGLPDEPGEPYEYETNPQYTWGYGSYWGAYYKEFGNNNHIISVSLFTELLTVEEDFSLAGKGQYLYLEDVYVAPGLTELAEGTYEVNESWSPFSIAPGEEIEYDGELYSVGAYILYMEENENYSTLKFIVGGTMTVAKEDDKTLMSFDFELADGTNLKGSFNGEFPYIDFSEYSGVKQKSASRQRVLIPEPNQPVKIVKPMPKQRKRTLR